MTSEKIVVHAVGGYAYYGAPYSLCTISEKVQMSDFYVTCRNCIRKLDAKAYKKQLRNAAEDRIAALAKGMRKDNWIEIQAAANRVWRDYEKQVVRE